MNALTSDKLMPGTQFGEYTVIATLGRGGQGYVYEVEDALGMRWALKVTNARASGDDQRELRLRREAKAVYSLLSTLPKDCGVLVGEHYGVWEGRFYIKMRLLQGRSLAQHLARVGQLTIVEAIDMGRKIARAVDHAHRAGVVHRDLKPENIFLTTDDEVLVLDWGCLQVLEEGAACTTGHGGPMCTPGYAPLEQLQPGTRPEPTMDVYALGVVLYEMLSGWHPFLGVRRGNAALCKTSAASRSNGRGSTGSFGSMLFSRRPTLRGMSTAEAGHFMAQPTPDSFMPGASQTLRVAQAPVVRTAHLSELPGPPSTRTAQPPERLGRVEGGVQMSGELVRGERARGAGQAEPAAPRFGALPLREVVQLQQSQPAEAIVGIPTPLWSLIRSMLSPRAVNRPQTMTEVVAVLEEAATLARVAPGRTAHVGGGESRLRTLSAGIARLARYESLKQHSVKSSVLVLSAVAAVVALVQSAEHMGAAPESAAASTIDTPVSTGEVADSPEPAASEAELAVRPPIVDEETRAVVERYSGSAAARVEASGDVGGTLDERAVRAANGDEVPARVAAAVSEVALIARQGTEDAQEVAVADGREPTTTGVGWAVTDSSASVAPGMRRGPERKPLPQGLTPVDWSTPAPTSDTAQPVSELGNAPPSSGKTRATKGKIWVR